MNKKYIAYAVNEAIVSLLTVLGRLEQEVRWCSGGEKPTEWVPKGICRYLLYDTVAKELIWSEDYTITGDTYHTFRELSNFISAVNFDLGGVAQKSEVVKEDNHKGMVYNPYTDDWSWF